MTGLQRLLLGATLLGPAWAQGAEDEATWQMDPLEVIGSKEDVATLPGSGAYLDREDIDRQSYDDINRSLRQVPGVYVREEDGYGLFPNISLRGVDPGRSSKVMLLEDGIPQAPAPYSAPSAYYSPTTGRMSGIEILKGSSQVRYGPQITGGVINYLSTPIPGTSSGYYKLLYGDDNEWRTHAWYGDTVATAHGNVGFLAEIYYRRADGFKTIDQAPRIDRDATGFDNRDINLKLSWEPDSDLYQRFELKVGRADLDADETYLGLSDADFDDDPYRRYAASRFDNIARDQERIALKHFIALSSATDVSSALYYNEFARNWFKLASVNGGVNPATAIATGGPDFDTLLGRAAGTLEYRANAREYYAAGAQSTLKHRFSAAGADHEVTAGVRLHQDEIDRFQQDTVFDQDADGAITGRTLQPEGEAGDRIQNTRALAMHIDDRITFGRLSITPGLRYERLDQEYEQDMRREDGGGSPASDSGDLDVWGGGLGLNWRQNANWSYFGGVFRGFATPAPRDQLRGGLAEETSLSTEAGVRYARGDGNLHVEAALFQTDFDDLIAQPNLGAGTVGDADNVGEVRSRGIEFSADWDPGNARGWRVDTPLFVALTYTDAEITNAATSTDPESIFSGGDEGNELPYIPDFQATLGAGIEGRRWRADVSGSYVAETFATASNTDRQLDPQGNPDARYGKTDSYLVVDASARYTLDTGLTLIAGAHNLLDEEYIVSRVPLGARPGKPRFLYVSLESDFE